MNSSTNFKQGSRMQFKDKEKPAQIRSSNIVAAKGKTILKEKNKN